MMQITFTWRRDLSGCGLRVMPEIYSPEKGDPMKRRTFSIVWVSYFTVCMLAFIWPLAVFANKVEPTIGGFPLFFAWFILWVLLIFGGSVAMYFWDQKLIQEVADDE